MKSKTALILILICVTVACLFGCNRTFDEGNGAVVTPIMPSDNILPVNTEIPDKSENPVNTMTPDKSEAPVKTTAPVVTAAPEPELPLTGIIICIDAGHQNKANNEKELCAPWSDSLKAKVSSGTEGIKTKVAEYDVNLRIALKARDLLSASGATVFMIRETNDVNISNRERAELTNKNGCDITINIHCNGASSESANGIECYVRDKGDNTSDYRKRSDYDYALAEKLLSRVCEETGAKKRGTFRSDNYTGINWRENTAIILECGFMSNSKEDALLASDDYQGKIAQGILQFFLLDYTK